MRSVRVDEKAPVTDEPREVCVQGQVWKLHGVLGKPKGDQNGSRTGQGHHRNVAPCNEKANTDSNKEASSTKHVHLHVFGSTSTILHSAERSSLEGIGTRV